MKKIALLIPFLLFANSAQATCPSSHNVSYSCPSAKDISSLSFNLSTDDKLRWTKETKNFAPALKRVELDLPKGPGIATLHCHYDDGLELVGWPFQPTQCKLDCDGSIQTDGSCTKSKVEVCCTEAQ